MKKNLMLAVRLLNKNKLTNVMVIIIAFLTFYISSTLYNQYYSYYKTAFYFENTPLDMSLLFMGREPVVSDEFGALTDPKYINKFLSFVQESDVIRGTSKMYNRIVEINEGGEKIIASFRAYDSITAEFIKDTISYSGKWLFEETYDKIFPIIIRNSGETSYKLGDIIEINMSLSPETTLLNNNKGDHEITISCNVVGIANNNTETAFFLGPIKRNYVDTIENTFYCTPVPPNQPVIYFPYDEKIFEDYYLTSDTILAYFKPEATHKEITDFYSLANSLGYSQLGSDIIEASRKEGDFKLKKNFFVFYPLAILMITSFFSVSLLNVKRTKKIFAIYYLNGCAKIKAIIIYYLYYLFIYTIPLLLCVIATKIMNIKLKNSMISAEYMDSSIYRMDGKVIVAAWTLGIIISGVATLISIARIRNKSIIFNLKEN